eukprot:SAG11_NODE_1980_length_3970_cov_4.679669_1_plen_91_part_00
MNIWEYNLERFELLRVQFCTTLVGYLVYIAFGTRFVFTRSAHFLFLNKNKIYRNIPILNIWEYKESTIFSWIYQVRQKTCWLRTCFCQTW